MKKIKIIIAVLLAIQLNACKDFLEPAPISSIGSDAFYSTEAELETGVVNMYDGLQGINSTDFDDNHAVQIEFYLTEMRSDNTRTKSSEGEAAQFESYDVLPTNGIVANYYASMYNIIYRANVVLANLDVASETTASLFEGEAKFVRAYAYFNLVRLFGDVPLATEVILADDEVTAFTRVATSKVYETIVSDLTTAVANLSSGSVNRASKGAAQGLLAKVHLTLGNYPEAKTLCEDIIGSGGYQLQDRFIDVFYNERNSEILFAISYTEDLDNDSQNFSAEMTDQGRSSGVNYVTDEMLLAFNSIGGERRGHSIRVDPAQPAQTQVLKYMPTGFDSVATAVGDTTVFNPAIEATASNPELAGNDWIVLRYADVLLMHVEATIGAGSATSDGDALASFQLVRDRAGLTDIVTTVSKQDLLDERRVELAFENQRFFDLIRFEAVDNVLGAFAANNGHTYSGTDQLLPIPQRELNLSGDIDMSQNLGY